MTDRPILFSAPMIRALLAGRKTQTRRVLCEADPEPEGYRDTSDPYVAFGMPVWEDPSTGAVRRFARTAAVGDRLWVREAWSDQHCLAGVPIREREPAPCAIWYWADGDPSEGDYEKPRPSIHMPRWASRLTLIVTEVRVQRVQEISEDDARAEGVRGNASGPWGCEGLIEDFSDLWDSLNAPRGFGWDANPWVVALTFRVFRANIDSDRMKGEAA